MNFTPNQAQALAGGRVQQQQVHQNPVTTSSAGAPQGASMQKSGSQPFPVNQQPAQKLNDDKNQIPPTSAHQIQMPPQNNNNHGMGGPPHQLLNAQHQQNLNRNVNLGSQPFPQQPPHMLPSMTAQGGQKNFFHQMQQQVAYQQNQFQSVALSQAQQPHHTLPSQSILQKLQASAQQPLLKQQLPQQSMKPVTIQPPPVVSQHMQYSPSKPNHPQMKTTAKLASPGSQLQILQKSPTTPSVPMPTNQQASPQNKTVPSTPPTNAAAVPAVPPVLSATAPPPLSPVKLQTQIAPVKQPPAQTTPSAPTSVSSNASPVVPSPALTITPQSKAIPAPVSVVEQSPIKPVEQAKDSKQPSPQQNKTVPKATVDEKKPVPAPNNAPPPQDTTNNKVEVVPVVAPEKVQPPKPVAATTAPIKSTMRLATVTPPRQKKPPATIKKTVTSVTTASSPVAPVALIAQKSPAKPAVQPAAKPAESPKSPAKRPQAAAPAPAVTPKSNTAPSTSSAQSNSSSNSTNISPKTKRPRVKVQPYQSPTPELALVTKLSTQIANSSNKNGNDEKLTLFYKNEFLAVRNPEGTFYLCQAAHNVYKPASKIRIRWLNEGKPNAEGERTYTFDFFDVTDFECVLTTVDLDKIDSKNYELSKEEQTRIESILKKAIDVEKGIVPRPTVTEENPDGLDLSLYKDEAQLDKSPRKRKRGQKSEEDEDEEDDDDYEESPRKKKSAKKSPAAKPSRASTKKAATYESSESDEENLMEIQKKAKKQAATPRPSTSKASEPMPSTSTATPAFGKGRKRVGKLIEEVQAKIAKPSEKLETPKAAPKPKGTPKAKPVKKAVAEKPSPAAEKSTPEKKTAKKAVEEKPVEVKVTPAKSAAAEKVTPVKVTPAKKKTPAAAKASPSASPADQPSTSRSRNTRSKK